MEAHLFISLGTRDIQLLNLESIEKHIPKEYEKLKELGYPIENEDNNKVVKKKNFNNLNVRKFGHWLKDNFEDIKDNIDIQIIEPFLKWLKEQNKNISKIYLIATNQKEEKDPEHIKRDTCVIADFLKEKFFPFYFQNYLPEVEIIELNDKPNDYDLMIKEIAKSLMKVPEKNNINQYDVYAEITGGTPQINTALMLNCIKYFRKKVKFIYKSESTTEIKSLEIGKYILKNYEHEALQRLVERYDFDAISKNENYPEIIRKLAECACYRMNFDFYNYKQCISDTNQSYSELSSYENIGILQEDADNLFRKSPEAVFNEIYWNAVIMWKRNECANFIGRVWRIKEAVMQYALIDIINCPWKEITEKFKNKFIEWARNDKDFIDHLINNRNEYGLKDKVTKEHIIPSSPILNASVDFLAQGGSANSKSNINFEGLSDTIKKLNKFSNMRNNSIIAHGFEPISKQQIEKNNKEDILNILQELIKSIGIQISDNNPYDIFGEIIKNINEKYLEQI